ncbi:CIR protein PIR protein [Plasmodium vinckei brucechwatti]|uniref:CIR protein PIR protein n=1 Tax=Plasmodium vinckei brucechwatti TaxID=119398 RepID=A0A6V7S0G0_PLAVN|nr:CIR protein PIR protein [Plasmodium vinckei brucechwatti]
MANPSYNINDVYGAIYKINNYFGEFNNGGVIFDKTDGEIHKYCHYRSKSGSDKCRDYLEKASSGVIHLLKELKGISGLEYEQLAEYAILWLSYKLNISQKTKDTKLNDFYTKYIETNKHYNNRIKGDGSLTYKDIIDKKKNLIYTNDLYYLNHPFSLLCYLYTMTKYETWVCGAYLQYANLFAESFKKRSQLSDNIEGSSYNKILSTLSDDYCNLKKTCKIFPSLPKIEPKKKPSENPVQSTALSPEATSSSSSISTTLIPGLSVVSVIPVFLGIAYKYSLFGVDKLFQRQYLRKKLKNVKKKMKLNI